MKVVFTGLPFFASQFAAQLSAYDPLNKYVFCNTYESKLGKLKFMYHCLNADLVVSFNGVTSKSMALDYAIFFKKKILMQWQGTDVLTAQRNLKNSSGMKKYIDYAYQTTDAIWLKDELHDLGIETDLLAFKSLETAERNFDSFKELSALSYIAKGREEFYGMDKVAALAVKFPNVKFNVIGTDNDTYGLENLIFHGWVNKETVADLGSKCPIFIRLTDHDGYSLSVLEALSRGNYVVWNNPHQMCTVVSEDDNILVKFSELVKKLQEQGLIRNNEGVAWVSSDLNEQLILDNFIDKIKAYAKR